MVNRLIFRIVILSIGVVILSQLILAYGSKENGGTSSLSYHQSGEKEWKAPASANKLKNPFAKNSGAAKDGKKIYDDNCAICHGDKGKGDGPAGAELVPKPHDLASSKVQKQTDGALFWKISTGNPPMDGWEKTLTEKQRWELVNYIRELKKK